MRADEIRFLFAYDRWATERLLASTHGLDDEEWAGGAVGDRNLADVLTHMLGAHMRWRAGWEGSADRPRPERGPRPSPEELRAAWRDEWAATDRYLAGLTDEAVAADFDDVPLWQTLLHLVNHDTQHRSEAAAILTDVGSSPGDLDLIDYVVERNKAPLTGG